MSLRRWAIILLVIMAACAVVGLLVDAVRFFAGAAFVVCLLILIGRFLTGQRSS